MDFLSILTIVSLVLGVVSTTLAIAAFIFGWVSFRNSFRMQVDAQSILAKVSEKVEVIIHHTSHQLNKAWDYVTQPTSKNVFQPPELPSDIESRSVNGEHETITYDEARKALWGILYFVPRADRRKVIERLKAEIVRDKALDSLLTSFLESKLIAQKLSPIEQHIFAVSKEFGENIFGDRQS